MLLRRPALRRAPSHGRAKLLQPARPSRSPILSLARSRVEPTASDGADELLDMEPNENPDRGCAD